MRNKPNMAEVAAAVPNVTLIDELGEGGFKVAYRAEVSGKTEAVKIARIPIDPNDSAVEETNRRRLRRELELLRNCQSPFLVKLGALAPLDCQIAGYDYVCYSEELIEGESLRTKILAGRRPSQSEVAEVGFCLLSAVEELAGMQAVHRDIKPENVITSDDPRRQFILLDLGIAFVIGGTNLTMDSQAVPGTRYYIAPEMLDVDFRQSLDYRADLYTIGLTLYEYASGINPFANPGDPPMTTLYRIKHQNPRPLASLRGDIDTAFCLLIDQLIKKLPALRPANLAQLIGRMESYG